LREDKEVRRNQQFL